MMFSRNAESTRLEMTYTVRLLERWRLTYPRIIQEVASIPHAPLLLGHHLLLVDATGVGVAVFRMLDRPACGRPASPSPAATRLATTRWG
jgi:hypothetical protein